MAWLETLRGAFKGAGDKRVPLAPHFIEGWLPGLGAQSYPERFEYGEGVRDGYLGNPIAQRAVRIVAEGIAQAPLSSSNAQLQKLIEATSAGQSLLETLAANLLLHGNGFVQIIKDESGAPVELFALRPDRITIIAGADGWPCGYDYTVGDTVTRIEMEDAQGWPSLIAMRAMHPTDDHYGASALAAAMQAITIHNTASRWNRSLLANGARPSGALVHENSDGAGLSSQQFDRLKSELASAFAGPANAGRPMLLDGGLKWQSMAFSPADMDFATLKETAAREIALAFGVPPMLLGLPGDNTYANYREANRALWRLTLLPLASKLLSALGEGLAPFFPQNDLSIRLDQVPALSEDRERLWKQVSDADFLTDNEKREMLGLPHHKEVQ